MQSDKKPNNKNSNTNNFLKENGFLIAVYSVVGILVVVAVALTFFMPTTPKDELIVSIEDTKNVSNNLAQSYKTQVGTDSIIKKEEPIKEETKETDKETKTETKTEEKTISSNSIEPKSTIESSSSITASNEIIYEDSQTLASAQPTIIFNTEEKDTDIKKENTDSGNETAYEDESDYENFANAFSDNFKMIWPTKGDVVFGYSKDALVYDVTLDQYRTTDSIDIKAEVGQDVFASYDGVVKMISKSMDQGNYVVLDHGNGWVTTYSQLDDSMKVAVGDEIKKGQQIGSTALPTTKSVALGSHLDFKVTKNNESIDPLLVLE